VAFVVRGGIDCRERERVEELTGGVPCNSTKVLMSVFRRLRGTARCPSDVVSTLCLRRILLATDCFSGWTGPEGVGDDISERDGCDGVWRETLEPAIGADGVSCVVAGLVPAPVDEEGALPFIVLGDRASRSFPFPFVEKPKMSQIELSSGGGAKDVLPGD
jgi:hypothetical protein